MTRTREMRGTMASVPSLGDADAAGQTCWPDIVDAAVAECVAVVLAGSDANWAARAGRLEWDCRATVLHLASDFVGYAGQLTAPRLHGYVPFDVVLEGNPGAEELAEVLRATGGLLASVGRTTRAGVLSWHPYGMAGPADFCAMGAVEALVHTYDVSLGLKVPWAAPEELAAPVLQHLFTPPPLQHSSWHALLLATGRIPDDDGHISTSWRWHNTGT
jgi:hypothetical protein